MRSTLRYALIVAISVATPEPSLAGDDSVRTGKLRLTSTIGEIAGVDPARTVENVISPDEPVTWNVFVPESYEPRRPAGLIVYISPSPSGEMPRGWRHVLENGNLIWIAAEESGNQTLPARRALYALVAPMLAGKTYEIDPERIYLAGLSGGGKMAGMVAADYPHLFKGAIYNCGIDSLENHPTSQMDLFERNHYVFLSGTRDQALQETKRVHKEYLKSGVENSKLIVVPNMGHRNPDSSRFALAIRYLDSRSTREVSTTPPDK